MFKDFKKIQKAAVLDLGAFSQAKDSASLTVSDRTNCQKPSHHAAEKETARQYLPAAHYQLCV